MIANGLGVCMDELDDCTTDEERVNKSMVVLGAGPPCIEPCDILRLHDLPTAMTRT